MGDKSAIIPLDIRNGVILTKNGVSYRTPTSLTSLSYSLHHRSTAIAT